MKRIVLEYLGLSPAGSTISNLTPNTHESALSDLSTTDVTHSASITFEKEASNAGSPVKLWRVTRPSSHGLESRSHHARITESVRSPVVSVRNVLHLSMIHTRSFGSLRSSEEGRVCPVLFDSAMALQSRETHNITLKNMALFRPKLRNSYSTNHIARFVTYYFYFVNVIEFSIRLKNGKNSHGIEI